ncbi:MAG: cytochrome c maturation protein CcmE [Sandaracinaceae bacterium]|nr:cytochrome c maturation protein CcmE [Sandaracinaceae bacterium]
MASKVGTEEDALVDELRAEPAAEPARTERAVRATRAREPGPKKGGVPTWVPIVVVVGLLAVVVTALLATTDFSEAFVYSKLVDEVMVEPDEFLGRELRVEGELRQGSVQFSPEPCEHRFVLERQGREMPVRFPRCEVPDTFRDDMGISVVVQGRLQSDHTFLADQIIPRCPSKYEMRQRQENGETMPHSMPAGAREAS